MGKKLKTSQDRVFSLYENSDIAFVTAVNNAFKNKDSAQIKLLFNKPTISDSTAMAYGRLSSQYINTLSQPNIREKAYIKKRYGITVKNTTNQANNLRDNILLVTNNPRPKKSRGGGGGGFSTSLFPYINPIIQSTLIKMEYQNSSVLPPSNIFLTDIDIFSRNIYATIIAYNRTHIPIRFMRITVKYEMSDGTILFFSTKKVNPMGIRLEVKKITDSLDYHDMHTWKNISGDIEDIIDDYYRGTITISRILMLKIDYYL